MEQIKTLSDYYFATAEIEIYLAKGFDNLTPKEDGKLERLSKLVNGYEQIHFPIPVKL